MQVIHYEGLCIEIQNHLYSDKVSFNGLIIPVVKIVLGVGSGGI